jgi:hypothetical protein
LKFELVTVETFPKDLEIGKLYHSPEFKTSRHLCACGCGDVIRLPIDHLHHRITIGPNGPTVRPSIGNWHVCDAHYYITDGSVEWLPKWSSQQIAAGRRYEDERRELYFKSDVGVFVRLRRVLSSAIAKGWRAISKYWQREK